MVETIEINKLKEAIKKLKLKYGINGSNYPSKIEVLKELLKILGIEEKIW